MLSLQLCSQHAVGQSGGCFSSRSGRRQVQGLEPAAPEHCAAKARHTLTQVKQGALSNFQKDISTKILLGREYIGPVNCLDKGKGSLAVLWVKRKYTSAYSQGAG